MLIPLAIGTVSCASRGPATETDVAAATAAIQRGAEAFAAAVNGARFNDLTPLYAEDAILLAPEAPIIKTRPAIVQFWNQAGTALKLRDMSITTEQIEVHGDIAIETGTYRMTLTPPGAPAAVTDQGKFMVVWKRSAGNWQIYRDMFNTSLARQ